MKPCPFCAGPASLSTGRTGGDKPTPMQYVECDHCGATAGWSAGPGEAEEAWNLRATPSKGDVTGDDEIVRPLWSIPINGKVTAILVNPAPYAYIVNLAGFPSDAGCTVTWRYHNGHGGTLTPNHSLYLDGVNGGVKAIEVADTSGA